MITKDKAQIAAALRKAVNESNVGVSALGNVNENTTLRIAHIETARAGSPFITSDTPMYHLVVIGSQQRFQVSSNGMPALRCVKETEAGAIDFSKLKTTSDLAGEGRITFLKNLVDELDGNIDVDTLQLKCIGKVVRTTDSGEPAMLPRFYKGSAAYYNAVQNNQAGFTAIADLYASGKISGAETMTIASHPRNFAWTPVFAVKF